MPKIRLTIRPDEVVEVDEREAAELRHLGLIAPDPKPAPVDLNPLARNSEAEHETEENA